MNNYTHILVVDDDSRMCRLLSRYLEQEGYWVSIALNKAQAMELIQSITPNLVLLDWMLPDGDGLSIAQTLRNQGNMGIIMLTGKNDPIDKVIGLEVGADDYVTKPFDQRELLARIRSVLRRLNGEHNIPTNNKQNQNSIIYFSHWKLNLQAHELFTYTGEVVYLTTQEFMLLAGFVNNPHRVFNRDELLDIVSGKDWNPLDRSIDVLVGKLRKKIEADPKNPKIIKTIRGVGYKFVATISYTPDQIDDD